MSKPANSILTVTAHGPGAAEFIEALRRHAATLGIRPLSTAFHDALNEMGGDFPPQLHAVPDILATPAVGHA